MGVNFSGQVGLVTGASSGLGPGIAHALARAGVAVGINQPSQAEPAEWGAFEIPAADGRARAFSADGFPALARTQAVPQRASAAGRGPDLPRPERLPRRGSHDERRSR